MKKFFAWVNEGVFGWGSPTAMAVFRILFGTMHLANWFIIGRYFDIWFGERGYVPIDAAKHFNGLGWRFNPFAEVTNQNLLWFWYLWMVLCAILVTIGLFTRVASIMLAALTVAFHIRNPVILHGGDTLLRNMSILLALSPCGAALSIDSLLRRKRGDEPITSVSLWPQRMMMYQLTLVYVTTVWHKWHGNTWRDGTATWFPPQLMEFEKFHLPAWFDQQPMLAITTYGTLIIELALGSLAFWKPTRKYAVIGGLLLHAFIEYRFNIPLFAFTICSCYVMYYSGEEWEAWLKRWAGKFRKHREEAA